MGTYAALILKGALPSDLPIQQPKAFELYQRHQGLTVAQVLDVIEATRSGSSAKKRHAAQDFSTMSS